GTSTAMPSLGIWTLSASWPWAWASVVGFCGLSCCCSAMRTPRLIRHRAAAIAIADAFTAGLLLRLLPWPRCEPLPRQAAENDVARTAHPRQLAACVPQVPFAARGNGRRVAFPRAAGGNGGRCGPPSSRGTPAAVACAVACPGGRVAARPAAKDELSYRSGDMIKGRPHFGRSWRSLRDSFESQDGYGARYFDPEFAAQQHEQRPQRASRPWCGR